MPAGYESDLPSGWAAADINEGRDRGLIPEDLQHSYRSNITREEFCRVMIKLVEHHEGTDIDSYLSSKGLKAAAPFTDTSSRAVAAAYALGIVNGDTPTRFLPDGSIIRQEAAAMLARTGRLLGFAAGRSEVFVDTAPAPDWAKQSIDYVSGLVDTTTSRKVMGGTGSSCFSPNDTFTREEAYVTALRLLHIK